MEVRKYKSADIKEILQLFYDTVHAVNVKDYTQEQVDVWATGDENVEEWDQSLLSHHSYVAVENGLIVGFGDIDETGYLDRLFVHKDYQKKGIATALCNKLESLIDWDCVTVKASITAKSFFEKRNYVVVQEQQVERNGILLKNYIMQKGL